MRFSIYTHIIQFYDKRKYGVRFFNNLWEILQVIGVRFVKERFTYSASALTVTTLLAIVPLLAVIITVLSFFPAFHNVGAELQQFIFQNFIPASGKVIQQYIQVFIAQASNLSISGTIFLIVTAIMMMLTIERALNDVWKIRRRRYSFAAMLRYWAVLSLAPIMIGLSLMGTSYVVSLPIVTGTAISFGIHRILYGTFPFLVTVFVLTLLYTVVPNRKVPIRYAIIGALTATILFDLAKKSFVLYLTHFPTYRVIYGALATIPIFIVWIYFSWVIVLFGALISNVLTMHRYVKKEAGIDGFTHAFLWLGFLWEAQKKGKGLRLKDLYDALPGRYRVDAFKILTYLKAQNFVTVVGGGDKYMLSRDFSSITLAEFYRELPWKLSEADHDSSYFSKKMRHALNAANKTLDHDLNVPLSELF